LIECNKLDGLNGWLDEKDWDIWIDRMERHSMYGMKGFRWMDGWAGFNG
jgi:hypothetical protein